MNISKFLPNNTFEFDQLWNISLENVAPIAEVELVLTLLDVVADVVPAETITWTTVDDEITNMSIHVFF